MIQNNVLKQRGIACAVNFEGQIFLVTSSSTFEAKDHQKNLVLIAERYSRKHFMIIDLRFQTLRSLIISRFSR